MMRTHLSLRPFVALVQSVQLMQEISTVPSSGIAWRALMTIFWMTWLICPVSALTSHRSSGMLRTIFTLLPLKANSALSVMVEPMAVLRMTGSPPREKVSNCAVRSLARMAAFSVLSSMALAFSGSSRHWRAMLMLPRIPTSKLLKSWAIPPARTPTDSSFLTLKSSSSVRFSSVTSRNTMTDPITALSGSRIGAPLLSIILSLPSFAKRIASSARSIISPEESTLSTGFSHVSPVLCEMIWKTSGKSLPTASCWRQPVRVSAILFISTILPSSSVVITPSPILLSVTASLSFSDASSCCAILRVCMSRKTARTCFLPSR